MSKQGRKTNLKMIAMPAAVIALCVLGIVLLTQCKSNETGDDDSSGAGNTSSHISDITSDVSSDTRSEQSQNTSDADSSETKSENTSSKQENTSSEQGTVVDETTGDGSIIYIEGVGYDLLSVVNKNYRLATDAKSPNLVTLPDSTTDRGDVVYKLDARAAKPLAEFLSAARKEGYSPIVYSTYRTPKKQESLYESAISKYLNANPGATREEAEKNVTLTAPTGTSEHCIGLAIDIYSWAAYNKYGNLNQDFDKDPLCKWLMANAHKYGFILRYPKDKEDVTMIGYESWHFRYVGVKAATEIYERGICLEEYTGKLG